MSRPVVLVWRADEADPPPGIEDALEHAHVLFAGEPAHLTERIAEAEVLFFYRASKPPLEEAFPLARSLRWIQSASAGLDGLLFPALVESDVTVTNARGVFDASIAEWVLGAMLAFAAGLHRSIVDQGPARWDSERHTEGLAGARLLVVGPGPIGRAAASLASAAGMGISAVGTHERDDGLFGRIHGPDGFHAALGEADFVLDSLPLTAETRHRFDAAAFRAMRPTARFLNVGRGATVDEAALCDALASDSIAGAALDVFEEEPLPEGSPLWSLPNAIVSPHICGDFQGWERAVVRVLVENLARYVRGEPLHNPVDKRAGFGAG